MSVCGFQVGNSFCRAYNRNISAYGKSFRNALYSVDNPSDKIYTLLTYTEKVSSLYSVKTSLFGKLLLLAPLSPNSKTDSDNDGNPDSKEFDFSRETKLETVTAKSNSYSLGASQFKSETGIDINSETVVPMISDPTKEDSDGDGIVDSRDAQPLEAFDNRFDLSDSNYINIINSNIYDKQIYADSIYNTRTEEDDGVPKYALDNMKIRAYGNELAFLLFPNASKFIDHFLGNTGNALWYDASPVVQKTDDGKHHYIENMNIVRELCETTVLDELCFMSDYSTVFTGATFSQTGGNTRRPVDWWFSIGDADAAMSIRCKKSGNSYTADIEYNILDFYDWNEGAGSIIDDFGGFVVDGEMFLLHVHGMAREMQTIGTYKTTMTWESGERLTIK